MSAVIGIVSFDQFLNCSAFGKGSITIRWFFDNGTELQSVRQEFSQIDTIEQSSVSGEVTVSSQIVLEGLVLSDQGNYLCKASNVLTTAGNFTATSTSAVVTIYRKWSQ